MTASRSCARGLEQTGRRLGPLTREEDLTPAYQVLRELDALCVFARDESEQETNAKELRHKEVKRLEIAVRKLLEELNDLKLVVNFQERSPYEQTGEVLTQLRNRLLQQLFEGSLGPAVAVDPAAATASWLPMSETRQRYVSGEEALTGLDRFTLEEFDRIRLYPTVVKRTEAFLEVCRHRLDEIERRRQNIAWEEEEPNPLELHTYGDLLHAYNRALNSVMILIDEKARQKTEEEKEIRKALETLRDAVQDFGPRLETIPDLVRERRDEELGRKLREAMKVTAKAEKGTLYGLGSPGDR